MNNSAKGTVGSHLCEMCVMRSALMACSVAIRLFRDTFRKEIRSKESVHYDGS
jgi:hypothetical protein